MTIRWGILLLCIIEINGYDGSVQNVPINFLSTYHCENDEDLTPFNTRLRTIGNKGEKALDFDVDLDIQFTELWRISLQIDQWSNGDWDEVYTLDGQICELVSKYADKGWRKFKEKVVPNIPDDCTAQPGSYKMELFELSRYDYDFPIVASGRFRATARVFDETDTEIVCVIIEAEA